MPVCPGESQLALNTLRLLEEITNDSNFRQVLVCCVPAQPSLAAMRPRSKELLLCAFVEA